MLPSFVLPCADALPGRSTAAAVMADPLTARLRKSLLVLIFVTRADADQFQSTRPRALWQLLARARFSPGFFHLFCSVPKSCKDGAILTFANSLFCCLG